MLVVAAWSYVNRAYLKGLPYFSVKSLSANACIILVSALAGVNLFAWQVQA